MRIRQDLHIHTVHSVCCHSSEQTVGNIVRRCAELGHSVIALTDHLWQTPGVELNEFYRNQNPAKIAILREELAAVDIPPGMRVLIGCETEMPRPGVYGLTPEYAETLDFVLVPADHFHITDFVEQLPSNTPEALGHALLTRFRSAVECPFVHAVAHPFMPLGFLDFYRAAIDTLGDSELLDAFGEAAERGVALGFTPGCIKDERRESSERLLSLARKVHCRIAPGSDAHDPAMLENLSHLEEFFGQCGLTEEELLFNAPAKKENILS